jgi:sugar phosphate isomerase/epimerase
MNRRHFIHRLGLFSAASLPAFLPASGADSAVARRQYKLCLNPGAVGVRANQRETLALAHQHGFEAVEPMSGGLAAMSAAERGELNAELKAKGLVWGAAGLPVDFRGDEDAFKRDLGRLSAAADVLRECGVTRVGTWLSPCHDQLTYTANFDQHRRRLGEVATVLRDRGLRLGLEYVGTHTSMISRKYPFVHTLAETRDLITAIGTGNVGLILDSWHWWQADDSEADLLALKATDVVAVDLNDAPSNLEKRRQRDGARELPAATGVIPVRPFLEALVKMGYDGPVRAEPFNRPLNDLENDAACAATIEALRKACDPAA